MIETTDLGNELKNLGYSFYSGVPCSFLKPLINYAINDCDYIAAANEGDAVAICAGAALGGRKSVAMMQNSGLTNATSPLTSLNYTFELPIMGFVSLRGEQGLSDEPQHELMGQITTALLETMQVKWQFLADNLEEARSQLAEANKVIESGHTFFFVVKKGTFHPVKLKKSLPFENREKQVIESDQSSEVATRFEALKALLELQDKNTVFLATTGKTGRELFTADDRPNNLYMVGSMGCISSLALGLALARPDKKVVAIDGDGSLLMRMGALSTNAYYAPPNLLHILLDNGVHDSTGGQDTLSRNTDFVQIASSSGYQHCYKAHSLTDLKNYYKEWVQRPGLRFLYYRIQPGSIENLGRPDIKPPQVKERLVQFLSN